ncbi:MAG: right-handed parallel beta-helix repeat-containing protein [Methanomassiliicoccales archaeon]|nr:right-handed parallel beta-helix repeat-containing protein [Methanomassiliicoccales archaeon]
MAKRVALCIGILAFALVLLLFLGAGHASATDVPSGDMTTDTVWASNSTYDLTGTVNVIANLTVQENVTVNMHGYDINVYGSMVVNGAADNWTIFDGGVFGSTYFYDGSSGSINYAMMGNAYCALGIYSTSVSVSNLQVYDSYYGLGYEFSGSERDIALTITNLDVNDVTYGMYAQNYNGSLDVTINGIIANYTSYPIEVYAWDPNSTGRLDLTVTDGDFMNIYDYIDIEADVVGNIEFNGCNFYNFYNNDALYIYDNYGDMSLVIDGAVFDYIYGDAIYVESDALVDVQVTNSVFIDVAGYGLNLYSEQGDMNFVMNNVTMTDVGAYYYCGGFDVTADNGSIIASLTDVHIDYSWWIGGWYAYNDDGTAKVNVSITDSTFNNTEYGLYIVGEASGDISVTNTEFTGVWDDAALYIYSETFPALKGDMTITLDNVLMDDVWMGIDPSVDGNISLSMESVVVNNTYQVGWFVASNADNTAVIDVMINNCSFSNATYGLEFVADTVGDYQVTNTVFTYIDYYAISMTLDHADMLVPIENVQSNYVGTFLDLHITFGNVDLVITDSVLAGNNGTGFLIDVSVNSNTLTNGFITLTVSNSTFMNAGGGIKTWSEELNPVDMTTTVFENIIGECMHFDVRSGDQNFTFADDDLTVINSGTGLWVYANDGDINLNFDGVYFNTNDFGVYVEVSSLSPVNMSMINMEIIDSVFEGGDYGIYGLSLNGGTVLINNSQFLGHSEVGYWFDSLYGEVNVEILNSLFDGSTDPDMSIYTVQQVDYEFDLVGRTGDWDGIWTSGEQTVDLPFTFTYDNNDYTQVYVEEDGWLGFNLGNWIIPIGLGAPFGSTDLVYNNDQFFGYKIADDNSSVMFTWYASESYTGTSLSDAFQIILYANGQIQINYAAMDSYADPVPFGIETWGMLYDMKNLYGIQHWETDFSSYLFTPVYMSDGAGVMITAEESNINAVVTNNTVNGYYDGGMTFAALFGQLNLEPTANTFTNIAGVALYALCGNSTLDISITNQTFERIWDTAIVIYGYNVVGGENSINVSNNVFTKVAFGVSSNLYVNDMYDRTGNDSLTVTVNFQDNVMTDAYGMVCWVNMYLYEPVNWTVSMQTTMTGNVMTQELYEGVWPFMKSMPSEWTLGSWLSIYDYSGTASSIVLDQTSTITDNNVTIPWVANGGLCAGSYISNPLGDTAKTVVLDASNNIVIYEGNNYIYGLEVESYMDVGSGAITDDTIITVENNQLFDLSQSLDWAIDAEMGVDVNDDAENATNADCVGFMSVTGNLIDGAYYGIYAEAWYDQDNSIGDWSVNFTGHVDGNQVLNVSYTAIEAELYGGCGFGANYWPLNDEVAVANFVMDYLFTVDDNEVSATGFVPWGFEYDAIYIEVEFWAEVDPSTLFTEANAWVTGATSVSRNQVTSVDTDKNGIDVYQWIGAEKTGMIDVNTNVAVDDNVVDQSWTTDSHGPGPGYAMWVENEIDVWTHEVIYTDAPLATIDLSMSLTGNEVTGGFRDGLVIIDNIDVEYGMSSLVYDLSLDISGNTITGVSGNGIDYQLHRYEDSMGVIELNIALAIESNIVTDCETGIAVDSRWDDDGWVYSSDVYGKNVTFEATVSDNTVSGAEYGMDLLGAIYVEEPFEDGSVWTYVNDFVVENNYINASYEAMYLEGTISVTNNVIEDCAYGVDWEYGAGELVGNTISADEAVYLYYAYGVLVQNNQIEFVYEGIYVEYREDGYTSAQILDNVLTCVAGDDPSTYWNTYGIDLYEAMDVVVTGNVITGAYYTVYMEGVINVVFSDNQVLGSEYYGVLMYYVMNATVEGNTITNGYYGLYLEDGNRDFIIGNNTISENWYDGIYVDEYSWNVVLYNNAITDNGDGVEANAWGPGELVWYVDAKCMVSRNDIDFEGPIYVLNGGSMVLEDLEMYVDDGVTVEEGGLLSLSDVYVDESWFFDVSGTLWASLSTFYDTDVFLGPTASAEIRTSTFTDSELSIDGCAPVIADNLFIGSGYGYGIVVKNGAAPTIVSNIIAMYEVGIYANGMDMGGIYDNLIVANYHAGLLAENCTGGIHDNIFLANMVEILLRDSDVSIEDNEIGYTDLIQVIANYAPLLGMLNMSGMTSTSTTSSDPLANLDSILSSGGFSIDSLASWVKTHNGIWAESSTVETSGNQYGLLNYALYAIDSDVTFTDDVGTIELVIPWYVNGEIFNFTANIYTLNGLFAARSSVHVSDCTIEVLDDALMLEASQAWIEGVTLKAGDFDYFIYGGSNVYNIGSTYSKAKVVDSHSLNEGTRLTLHAVDKGDPAVNVTITIRNAKGDIVFTGVTDADGKVEVLLIQYAITSAGKDDGFNPYTINATFKSGEKSMELTLNQSYQDATIVGEKESDFGALLAVIGVLVIILLIVAAVVVMRRRK